MLNQVSARILEWGGPSFPQPIAQEMPARNLPVRVDVPRGKLAVLMREDGTLIPVKSSVVAYNPQKERIGYVPLFAGG